MKRHYYYSSKRSIVYLNQQYLKKVFECTDADTLGRQAKVKAVIQKEITDFLEGRTSIAEHKMDLAHLSYIRNKDYAFDCIELGLLNQLYQTVLNEQGTKVL